MYAIIKTGGKQYRVAKNDLIDVELLHVEDGAHVEFNALFVSEGSNQTIGAPIVSGFIVSGEVVGSVPGPKLMSVKYKPNHTQKRKFGHRQHYSRVRITALGNEEKGHEQKKDKAVKENEHGA